MIIVLETANEEGTGQMNSQETTVLENGLESNKFAVFEQNNFGFYLRNGDVYF